MRHWILFAAVAGCLGLAGGALAEDPFDFDKKRIGEDADFEFDEVEGKLSLRFYDAVTGKPIQGARVTLREERNSPAPSMTCTSCTPNASAVRITAAELWGSCTPSIATARFRVRCATTSSMRCRRSSVNLGRSTRTTSDADAWASAISSRSCSPGRKRSPSIARIRLTLPGYNTFFSCAMHTDHREYTG